MVQQVDVVICGSGSAGLCAATWLARCGISCTILEKRSEPLKNGQADGVQCRTVEVFESFGLVDDLLREAYHVLEVAFWSPDGSGGICRTSRAADTAPGLSHQPHVILNQARVNGLLIEAMRRSNNQEVQYGYDIKGVEVDSPTSNPEAHCVTVVAERAGVQEVFKARYVLGCDGAHSIVRKSLGYRMVGDSSDAVWGVMDVYPRTNFPDIRKKATLRSDYGILIIIPREGGALARFYIELPNDTIAKDVRKEDLEATARRILHPYSLEIAETMWWSAYAIGQRLADHFSKDNRVFLTGDACHTHSPKAGQGMNVSLQDGYNLGWKLAAVLKGQASPDLLKTYNIEREKVANDLIEFDRYFTKLFSSGKESGITHQHFTEQFVKAGRYTAGLTAKYDESCITTTQESASNLAENLVVGMRFPSAQVVRFCDARAMQVVKAIPADGRWRLIIFAGDIREADSAIRLAKLAEYLDSPRGPARSFLRPADDIDSFIEPILVLKGIRIWIEQEQIPQYFWPVTGRWQMRDLHKIFVDDESYNSGHGKAYDFYGINPRKGVVVILRPDQYISTIVAMDDHLAIAKFFHGFALPTGLR